MRERFEEFASRFAERVRPGNAAGAPRPTGVLDESHWRSLRELFTRDVTGKSFQDLQADTQDTFRFFTRDLDLSALAGRPWYKRYPLTVWKVFQAMAYRL